MKKFLTLLLTTLLCAATWADTVEFDFAAQGYENGEAVTELSSGGVTLKFDKGTNSNAPKWYNTGSAIRVYGSNTVTVSSTVNITKITLTLESGGTDNLTANVGTYQSPTWTGSAMSVVLTQGGTTGHVRIQKMVVTTDGTPEETVAAPTFNPAAGTFYSPINVAIACNTAGANIYYTTDGTTPSASSTAYSNPIALSETTTVKAIAVKGSLQSAVTEATYTFESATLVANIAAYNVVDDNTMVQFTNPVTAVAQHGSNLYVRDDSGYALIYGSVGQKYNNGQTIPAGFIGQKITYNGLPELKNLVQSTFQAGVDGPEIAPEEIQCEDVNADMWGHYVFFRGVTIVPDSATAKGGKMTDASGTVVVWEGMGGYSSGKFTDPEAQWDVYAIVGAHKGKNDTIISYQVLPINVVAAGTVIGEGMTIAEFQALDNDATAGPFNPVTVLAQAADKKRTFVKDATGYMLIYNNSGLNQTYNTGDIIPAGFTGKKTTYDGEPELTTPLNGFQASTESTTVVPEEVKADALKHDNFGHYVVVKNATFTEDGKLKDADGNEVAFFNNLGVSAPGDLTKTYHVYGIIGSYGRTNTIYQLLLTKVEPTDGSEVELPEVEDVQALFDLAKGTNARIKSDIVAIYQNGSRMYVKNNDTFTLAYGELTNTFENGDIIRDAVASWSDYQGAKQLVPVDSTFVVAEKGTPVQPVESVLEDMGQDMVHTYFIIKNAALTDSTITDETMTMKMFNQFEIDLTGIEEDAQYDVKGFLTVYKQELEIYPVEISKVGGEDPGVPGDVTGDGEVDIADVNAIINIMLQKNPASDYPGNADVTGDGGVDIADVNAVINIMLGK